MEFRSDGTCHVSQNEHVKEIISSWPEEISITDNMKKKLTPSSNDLFKRGEGELLSKNLAEIFHSVIAKGLLIVNRSRGDVLPTISVLSSRVKAPNQDDWKKEGGLCAI